MFVRKNHNRSGSVSVQIILKESGKYKVVKTVGTSNDPDEIEEFFLEAKNYVSNPRKDQMPLFATLSESDLAIKGFLNNLTNPQIHTIGPELIF